MSVKHDVGLESCRLVVVPVSWTYFGEGDLPERGKSSSAQAMWIRTTISYRTKPTNPTRNCRIKSGGRNENKENFISSKVKEMVKNGNGTERNESMRLSEIKHNLATASPTRYKLCDTTK